MKISYPNNGRKLRQMITGLLKSGSVTEIHRINYVKSYKRTNDKITKEEMKLIELFYKPEQEAKIIAMINKNRPEAKII